MAKSLLFLSAVLAVVCGKLLREINNTEKQVPKEPARETEKNARIFYGDDATQGQFPFMVRLSVVFQWGIPGTAYANYTYSSTCGGSIIGPRHVLTAAHCVTSYPSDYSFGYTVEPYNVLVYIGDHNADSEDGEVVYRAEAVNAHPDYSFYDVEADVAVITLSEDITFSEGSVEPIALPVTGDDSLQAGGSTVTVAGWGTTEDGYLADTLQYMEYKFMNQSDCVANWPSGWITDGMICTADDPNMVKKTWSGDSGSPLFVEQERSSSSTSKAKVLAVVSWGTSDEYDNSKYDVNADVYFYRDWIFGKMNDSNIFREEVDDYTSYTVSMEKYINTFMYFYPADPNQYIQVTITASSLSNYDHVIVYDSLNGSLVDGQSTLIAGIGREHNDEVNSLWTSQGNGAIVRIEGTDQTSSFGSVSIVVRASYSQDSENTVALCGDDFFTCSDMSYCIYDYEKCQNSAAWSYCSDGSDETCGCGMSEYCSYNNTDDSDGMMYYLYNGEQMATNISHGVLVAMDAGTPYFVCDDNAGATVATTICSHFGYSAGQLISPDNYLNDRVSGVTFGATNTNCPSGASDISSCDYSDYMENGVPCFDGEQLAVSCSNAPYWEFTADFARIKYRSKMGGTKVAGRAWCEVTAQKYGMELEDKSSIIGTALGNFNGTSIEWVDGEGQYVKSKDAWKLKIRKELSGDETKEDMCFVCFAWIEGVAFTYAVDTNNCGVEYSESSLDEIIYNAIS